MLEKFDKGNDLELHVSRVSTLDGKHTWIELSDYVPSRDSYRRGVVLPMNIKQRVGAAVRRVTEAR